jgi:hypothetical protein
MRQKIKLMQIRVESKELNEMIHAIDTDDKKSQKLWELYQEDFDEVALGLLLWREILTRPDPTNNGDFLLKLIGKLDPDDANNKLDYHMLMHCIRHNWRMLRFLLKYNDTSVCSVKGQLASDDPLAFIALKVQNIYSLVVLYLANPRYFECMAYEYKGHQRAHSIQKRLELMVCDRSLKINEVMKSEEGHSFELFERLFSAEDDKSLHADMIYSLIWNSQRVTDNESHVSKVTSVLKRWIEKK